jgi:hypothetical protein
MLPSGKKRTWAYFGVACAYGLFFGVLDFCPPRGGIPLPLLLSLLLACFGTAAYCAYRLLFFSNDWFRARDEKAAVWWDRHRRLAWGLNILALAAAALMALKRH